MQASYLGRSDLGFPCDRPVLGEGAEHEVVALVPDRSEVEHGFKCLVSSIGRSGKKSNIINKSLPYLHAHKSFAACVCVCGSFIFARNNWQTM